MILSCLNSEEQDICTFFTFPWKVCEGGFSGLLLGYLHRRWVTPTHLAIKVIVGH